VAELYCNLPPTVRLTNVIALALSCVALTATAQNTNTNATRSLSLRDALAEGLRKNLDVQIERYNTVIARFTLESALGAWDPAFTFQASHRYDDSPSYFAVDKLNQDFPYKADTDTLGPGISGKLPTGLLYDLSAKSVGINNARTDFTGASDFATEFAKGPSGKYFDFPGGIRTSNFYYLDAGITIRQPLLRNAWIDLTRQQIKVARKNQQISEVAFRALAIKVATDIQLAYYELVYGRENVKVQQVALQTATQFRDETVKRVKAGELTDLDQQAAQSRVETVQSDLLLAQQLYIEQQNALKQMLSDDFNQWRDTEIVPTEDLIALPEHPNRMEIVENALTKRPDILQMKLQLERQGIIVKFNYNQLFPTFDIIASGGMHAGNASFGAAADDLSDINHPYYSVGAILTIPFTFKAERNAYKASQALQDQLILRMRKLENDAYVQVDTAAKVLESAFKQVSSRRAARETAQAALDAEQKKAAAGVTTSFFVLERQSLATAARSAEIRALADYNKARAQLYYNEGTTLEKNMIILETK